MMSKSAEQQITQAGPPQRCPHLWATRSSLRRRDFNPMNFHLLADALQVLVVAQHRASFDDVTDPGRLHYCFCQANFVDTGETLHAGGDIHVLSEVVDPIIEPYGNGRASVHTDLKAERP